MMNDKGYDEQNLQTLATYLAYEPTGPRFDMGTCYSAECDTVACAMGYGPVAGMPKKINEAWAAYEHRVFHNNETVYEWCFAFGWERIDNTRLGAAKRIQYLLDQGGDVPEVDGNYDATHVALYANTEVKREHSQDEIVCPVADAPDSQNAVRNEPHILIADLLKKINREPKHIQVEVTK